MKIRKYMRINYYIILKVLVINGSRLEKKRLRVQKKEEKKEQKKKKVIKKKEETEFNYGLIGLALALLIASLIMLIISIWKRWKK